MSIDQMLGLITGVLFGFLLQKGRVLRFEKQVGAMLLNDMTIFKFMLSAILVGMVGIALLTDAGIITLSHKPMNLGAVLLGGALFGTGWAVMGFCPGTSIGARGQARRDRGCLAGGGDARPRAGDADPRSVPRGGGSRSAARATFGPLSEGVGPSFHPSAASSGRRALENPGQGVADR